tara:strand:- start:387 stop:638 length:252 start_codon:yes stop_codon:yes gene_type:complete
MKCFNYYAKFKKLCAKKKCRYWLNSPENSNCTICAAKNGPQTLQTIGDIFGITRMRVCQIEKSIIEKIKKECNKALFDKPSNY